jgi:S1-C subfamily serine protease
VQIGIGFAISSNTLKGILPDLLTPGEFRRPWIGISSQPMTSGFFASLGLGAESGIYVLVVCDNGPAAAAGIRGEFIDEACADGGGRGRRVNNQGDVITAVDGMAVSSVAEMVSYFNGLRPGDEVTVTVFREGSTQDVEVTLAAWMGG